MSDEFGIIIALICVALGSASAGFFVGLNVGVAKTAERIEEIVPGTVRAFTRKCPK